MSRFRIGIVSSLNLKDDDVNELYSIQVYTQEAGGRTETCYPIDTNVKRIPLIGESVLVFTGLGPEASGGSSDPKLYYIPSISVQKNVHNNALPGGSVPKKATGTGGDYATASAGTTNTSGGNTKHDYGKGFSVRDDVASLQPFIGDLLIEGRFGHSLRFGYTPSGAETTKQPTWSSSTDNDPITILSNGRNRGGSYNKFIIEDIDDDLSSIYLTSSQKISIKTSQTNLGAGVKSQSAFSDPTIVITSDRILLNSKEDYVILSGKKSVNIATPKWAVDMDKMFTLIEKLASELADLTSAKATYATGVGPTGPATNAGKVAKILSDIKSMAQ